jgi:hypothetical protein
MTTLLARRLLQQAATKSFPRSSRFSVRGSHVAAALTTTFQQHQRLTGDDRQVAAIVAASAAMIAGLVWQKNKADCCGIAGVVGTPGHDAR